MTLSEREIANCKRVGMPIPRCEGETREPPNPRLFSKRDIAFYTSVGVPVPEEGPFTPLQPAAETEGAGELSELLRG